VCGARVWRGGGGGGEGVRGGGAERPAKGQAAGVWLLAKRLCGACTPTAQCVSAYGCTVLAGAVLDMLGMQAAKHLPLCARHSRLFAPWCRP
jgi:hypothetical protein